MKRRRIWCETDRLAEVADDATLAALAARGIELIASIFPATEGEVAPLLARCERRGVRVSLWPMLDDQDGRWANALTMRSYLAMARRVLERTEGRPVASLFVDLEPPIALLREALRSPRRALARLPLAGTEEARDQLREAAIEARAAGVPFSAAALPVVLGSGAAGWEGALGVPVAGVPWEAVHVMMYSSLLEGYSGGWLGYEAGGGLVALAARGARAHFGGQGALSLGVVAPGALGDEQPLRSAAALRRDLGAARAAGVEDLALFDLVGARRRGPLEQWLDALAEAEAAPVALPATARLVAGASLGVGVILKAFAGRTIRLDSRRVTKRSLAELSFERDDFRATMTHEGIRLQGKMQFRSPSEVLGTWLRELHEAILQARIREFHVDVTELHHVNSSSLFLFIDWARWIATVPQSERYHLNFRTHRNVSWQHLSLPTMQRICSGYVRITLVA